MSGSAWGRQKAGAACVGAAGALDLDRLAPAAVRWRGWWTWYYSESSDRSSWRVSLPTVWTRLSQA
jgi:hypothetical protein